MVLINGAEGIGTGYSTNIPNFNPRDVVMNLKRRIRGLDFIPMHPWYRGFIVRYFILILYIYIYIFSLICINKILIK